MRYITREGTFDTLAELRAAYLRSKEDMKLDPKHAGAAEWASDTLHISELGYCSRMQMLRLSGAKPKVKNSLTAANDEFMWWFGNRCQWLSYEAMDWAGILHSCEQSVYDPPWSGRYDALFYPDYRSEELVGFDQKTTRPKAYAYAYSYPKESHILQVTGYSLKVKPKRWLIEYVFFGSTKPPVECWVDTREHEGRVLKRMAELEQMREALFDAFEVPDVLPEILTAHYRKAQGRDEKYLNRISAGCSWECSYCDMLHTFPPKDDNDKYPPIRSESPCHPAWHAPKDLATMKGGKWTYLTESESERDMVEAFIAAQPRTVAIVGGQDE